MPFFSDEYLGSLSKTELNELYDNHTFLGYHPETQDYFIIPDIDRYAGMYILGVQGVGKSSLLEFLIIQDINKGKAIIVIDPHGDLVDHVIAQLSEPTTDEQSGLQKHIAHLDRSIASLLQQRVKEKQMSLEEYRKVTEAYIASKPSFTSWETLTLKLQALSKQYPVLELLYTFTVDWLDKYVKDTP